MRILLGAPLNRYHGTLFRFWHHIGAMPHPRLGRRGVKTRGLSAGYFACDTATAVHPDHSAE